MSPSRAHGARHGALCPFQWEDKMIRTLFAATAAVSLSGLAALAEPAVVMAPGSAGGVKSLYFDHSEPQNVGHLFFAIKPDLFMSLTDFSARMDEFYNRIKHLPRAAGVAEIMLPGEPEQRREDQRRRDGIPVTANVVADLVAAGHALGVAFPKGRVAA